MIIVLLITLKILTAEGRVFCQDSFALPWRPLGYSCPVSCSAVISAVNRLQLNDEKQLNDRKRYKNLKNINYFTSVNAIRNRRVNLKPNSTWLYDTYTKLLKNEAVVNDLEIELSNAAAMFGNGTCRKMAAGNTFYAKSFKAMCTRRSSNFVLTKVAEVFNKYSETSNRVNGKTVQMLLEKLISHLNLRFGISDMQRVIYYLRKVLRDQRTRILSDRFVELEGQCVKPSDCSGNTEFNSYLDRVIFN